MCVYVRDTVHPADLYDSSHHWYSVSIHEIGSIGPLIWKGVNYGWLWLPFTGEFNKIAGEFEVPAGTYLVRGQAFCYNIVTHLAWVQVKDGETVSVNLVPTSVHFCILAARMGVELGTVKVEGKEVPLATIAQAEVDQFLKAAGALAAKLPRELGLPLLPAEEMKKRLKETPKKE
jgi:hypothetical protein